MADNNDLGLTAAVVFAGIAISASIAYVGMQIGDMGGGRVGSEKMIQKQGEDSGKVADDADEKPAEPTKVVVKSDPKAEGVKKIDATYDHVRGASDARITIFEYSDFECPYCQAVHPTLDKLVESYDGDVNWVYRDYPLSFHEPEASAKAEAAECVGEVGGNDKFWEYADALYEGKTAGDEASLVKLASSLGVDSGKVQSCLDSDKMLDRIAADLQEGGEVGVSGTPGNILFDNKTGKAVALPGAQPYTRFKATIDAMLAE